MSDVLSQAIAAYEAHTNPSDSTTSAATSQATVAADLTKALAGSNISVPGAHMTGSGVEVFDPSYMTNYSAPKGNEVSDLISAVKDKLKPSKSAPAKKAAASSTSADNPTLKELEQQISAGNLWNQLGQQLVGQQEALDKPVEESISGALTAPAESTAAAQALSSMGLAPNSKASSWLKDQISQANTADKPLQNAMNLETKEYEQGQSGISSALGSMGQANALEISTAPQADWLTSLVQHIMSNVNYYGQYGSAAQAASVTPAIQAALAQSGGGGQGVSGSIPITDTPQQIAAAVQQYYAGKTPTGALPSISSASSRAAGGGTGGSIPSDVGTAPS